MWRFQKSNWDKLYDPQPEKVELAVRTLKDSIIGKMRQKEQILLTGFVGTASEFLVDLDTSQGSKRILFIINSI